MGAQAFLDGCAKIIIGAIIYAGTGACIFGAVQVGLALKDGSAGGGQLNQGLGWMVGGAVAAAIGMLAPSFLNSSFLGG